MTASDIQSSAEVQLEAETERAGLVNTLDQLRENLKPANVVDEVMASAKLSTSDLTDKVWQTARDNPIPAVLIGLGAAMLLGVGRRVRTHSASGSSTMPLAARYDVEPSRPQVSRSKLSSAKQTVGQRFDRARDRLSGRWDVLERQASKAASKITRSVGDLRREAGRSSSAPASQNYGSTSENTMPRHKRSPAQFTSSLTRVFEEQPLVLAALGVAVGAAIGAAIPATDVEADLMGQASASVKQAAQDMAKDQYAQLKTTATHALDDLKATAADHGLSKDNLSGLVSDVGNTVRDAAYEAGNKTADRLPRSS